jgi:hypothetical protein
MDEAEIVGVGNGGTTEEANHNPAYPESEYRATAGFPLPFSTGGSIPLLTKNESGH